MNLLDRILDYKRLAGELSESADASVAETLRKMCDEDAKLIAHKYSKGISDLEKQALEFILSIGRKARPGARDSRDLLESKAQDILMEISYFEDCRP